MRLCHPVLLMLCVCGVVRAQDDVRVQPGDAGSRTEKTSNGVENPFTTPLPHLRSAKKRLNADARSGEPQSDRVFSRSDGAPGGGMGMGMGMGMSMSGMSPPGGMGFSKLSPEELFQERLEYAIQLIRASKSEQETKELMGYVRKALEQRFDKIIEKRQRDLVRLRSSLAELEQDLKRREAARERMLGIQIQSVELAAEGLLTEKSIRDLHRD